MSTTDGWLKTQLCKLRDRDTSDTLLVEMHLDAAVRSLQERTGGLDCARVDAFNAQYSKVMRVDCLGLL